MTSCKNKSTGFTFVEVLVALVIIAIGVAGLVSLQRMFIQSSERASARTAAMEVARERLESLRFQAYEDLAAGSATVTRSDQQFSSNWTVTDQYYVAGTWVTASSPSAPTPLPTESDAKAVVVTVGWTERGGDAGSLELESWFTSVEARDGGLAVTQPGMRQTPQVAFNPGAAPDVIAIRLTDDDAASEYSIKETTKPTPEVSKKGERLRVNFDTVTYNQATQTQRIEDFMTVECECKLGSESTIGLTPARLILEDGVLVLDPNSSQPTTKRIGYPAGSTQPSADNYDYLAPENLDPCTICCRDHHDNEEMAAAQNVYRQDDGRSLRGGNHQHFTRDGSGNLVAVGLIGDLLGQSYEESCRMRRINGYFYVYPDWHMSAVTVMNGEYLLNSASAAVYEDYVRDVVYAEVMGTTPPAQPEGRDVEIFPGSYQMLARGIFVDIMSSSHVQAVKDAINAGEQDWLAMVPFYEVNLSLLSSWSSNQESIATVTNEPIETIVNPELNYYGTYSRGRVDTQSEGTARITATVLSGNAAVLGGNATHTNEQAVVYNSSVDAAITYSDTGEQTFYRLTFDLDCTYNKVQGNKTTPTACGNPQWNSVAFTVSNPNLDCERVEVDKTTSFFTCRQVPAGSSFSVTISYDGTATITPSSVVVSDIQADVTAQPVVIEIQ